MLDASMPRAFMRSAIAFRTSQETERSSIFPIRARASSCSCGTRKAVCFILISRVYPNRYTRVKSILRLVAVADASLQCGYDGRCEPRAGGIGLGRRSAGNRNASRERALRCGRAAHDRRGPECCAILRDRFGLTFFLFLPVHFVNFCDARSLLRRSRSATSAAMRIIVNFA